MRSIPTPVLSAPVVVALGLLAAAAVPVAADVRPSGESAWDASAGREVLELVCLECHAGKGAEAGFDVEAMLAHEQPHERLFDWRRLRAVVEAGSMPPPAMDALDREEVGQVMEWLDAVEGTARKLGGAAGHVPARRLTRGELSRSLRELLGVGVDVEALMPGELIAENGFETNAATLFVHAEWLQRADTVVRTAVQAAKLEPAAFEMESFLRRAFRRPATEAELERYRAAHAAHIESGLGHGEALQETLCEILGSPHFRLRLEDAEASESSRPVSAFGLASRLSFLLWSAPPDDALLDAAASGALLEDDGLANQVERLLDDERALDFARLFAGQWLGTRRLGHEIKPDPIDNPSMTDSVMAAMRDEVALFLLMLVREGRPLDDLLVADETFVDAELARFYGIDEDVEGTERIRLKDRRRRGILGKAAVLASTSYPDRTSPVLRGFWVLDDLLGTPPPPPPPGASDLSDEVLEEAEDDGPRALLELHRASSACASCHDRIDPLGFALEGFDRFGRARRRYGEGGRVDTRGELPSGTGFTGPNGLSRVLLKENRLELSRETARRFLRYGLGRPLTWRDESTVDELGAALRKDGFKALLEALIQSRPFRHIDPS